MAARREKDTLGEIDVPADALWGAQTQRAIENYPISAYKPFPAFVRAMVRVKRAGALANAEEGRLEPKRRDAIVAACDEILAGKHLDQFVVDVFHSGAGVSFHMNVNEVIANRANQICGGGLGTYEHVNPNDHVNMSQSTNDVTPTAMRLAHLELTKTVVEELGLIAAVLTRKATEYANVVKPGRTHLQDAVPITYGQELGAWSHRITGASVLLSAGRAELCELGIGGTAAGTGLNAAPTFRERVCAYLAQWYGEPIVPAKDLVASMQSMAPFVRISSGMRTAAIEISQICNDIRLLVSGPRTGFGELVIPAVQPGSSIMPGKVNPSIAEMVNQVCFQVLGCDTAVALASEAGQLELNVMMPVITHNVVFALIILANATRVFDQRCVRGIQADPKQCAYWLERSPALVTALAPKIGYAEAAKLAKEAVAKNVTVRQLVVEKGLLKGKELDEVLDLRAMTELGVPGERK